MSEDALLAARHPQTLKGWFEECCGIGGDGVAFKLQGVLGAIRSTGTGFGVEDDGFSVGVFDCCGVVGEHQANRAVKAEGNAGVGEQMRMRMKLL